MEKSAFKETATLGTMQEIPELNAANVRQLVNGSTIKDLGRETHIQDDERVHNVDEHQSCGRDTCFSVREQHVLEEEQCCV